MLARLRQTFLSFDGRIGRLRYAVLALLVPVSVFIVGVVVQNLILVLVEAVAGEEAGAAIETLASIAILVLIVWIGIAAAVRRLHDLGHSGRWALILIVPLVGFVVQIALLFGAGKEGENEYGRQPN